MKIKDLNDDQKAELRRIQNGLRIGKVVVTRAVKTSRGDFFVGWSAAWDTIQEDAGGMGADLIDAMDDGEQHAVLRQHGMSQRQARIASLILSRSVDLQAGLHALGGGAISDSDFAQSARAIKNKYDRLIASAVAGKDSPRDQEDSEE